jgi:hypothetical protein
MAPRLVKPICENWLTNWRSSACVDVTFDLFFKIVEALTNNGGITVKSGRSERPQQKPLGGGKQTCPTHSGILLSQAFRAVRC